jgi:2,3-bisphosphoglycerate-dependent phosphoglycerate mutase
VGRLELAPCRRSLLRHGESAWNSSNRFSGWVDVVHTSVLTRAIRSGSLALGPAGRGWIPARRHWRLSERRYGALPGLDRRAVRERYGGE